MKLYQKPELLYERFELSQHIAACELKFDNEGAASGILDGFLKVEKGFLEADTFCVQKIQGYCYYNSVAITGAQNS